MNSREIFEQYLLCDKSITLQFSSHSALRSFKSAIATYKRRFNSSLGMDITAGRILSSVPSPTNELEVTFSLVAPTQKQQLFTIVQLEQPDA